MSEPRLPFLLLWVAVNVLIRTITGRVWPEDERKVIKPHLRRALEMRRDLSRAPWWN